MTLPALPNQGATNWYAWASAIHEAVDAGIGGGGTGDVTLAGNQTFTGNNTFTGGATFTSTTSPLRSSTYFGLGAGVGSARMPFYQNSLLNGPDFADTLAAGGADDYVGHQTNVTFKGGFAGLKTSLTVNMTSGSATMTLSSGTIPSQVLVGHMVRVPGAGASGADLKARITAIGSTTQATLATAASTTVSGVTATASLAADPEYLFGANDFFVTGSTSGDLSGIQNFFGRLMEVHLYTPGATLSTIKATSSEAAIEASATGSTITTVMGHHVKAIVNRSSATVTNSYGLYVEGDPTTNATNSYAIWVNKGVSRFNGSTVITANNPTEVPLTIRTALNATVDDALAVYDVTGTNRVFRIAKNGAMNAASFFTAFEGLSASTSIGAMRNGKAGVRFGADQTAELSLITAGVIENNAKFAWVAANEQTTVGASGFASPLPSGPPTKYLKVVDSLGNTLVVPAYNAA